MRLVGDTFERELCLTCRGVGKLPNEDFQIRSGKWVRGGGYIPCPACRGSKLVSVVMTRVQSEDLSGSGRGPTPRQEHS